MPAIITPTPALLTAATASASANLPPHPVNVALILKIVIPLAVLAILGVVGLIGWLCRTSDYDESAPTNLRKKRVEEDPAPAYGVEAGPPTYFVPADQPDANVQQSQGGEEEEKAEVETGASGVAVAAGRDRESGRRL